MNSFADGRLLLIDKPLRWTSFDAVRRVRDLTGVKKVGHAGTLDPLATGLLIICTGRFTRNINEYMAQEKEYTGSITLGATTVTYDLESQPGNQQSIEHVTEEMIHSATIPFTGDIMQVPPAHSAIKVDGKRVYELARQGKEVKLEPRKLTVYSFDVTSIVLPNVYFKVVCSTGTYIRSLAHDFGNALGCGGYLSSLRRTRIGEFKVDDAMSIEQFTHSLIQVKNDDGGTPVADQNING